MTSVIGIASEDSASAPVIGFLLCLAFLHFFSKRPFKQEDNSTLGIVLTYALAFIFLGALLIKVNAQPSSNLERMLFEAILVFLLLMGPLIIIMNSARSVLMKRLNLLGKEAIRGERTARNKSIQIGRRRRQESLVRSLESRAENELSGLDIDGTTEILDRGSHREAASGAMQLVSAIPKAVVGDGIELMKIKEVRSRRTTFEDVIELENVEKELFRRSIVPIVDDGVELREVDEDYLGRSMVEDWIRLKGNEEEHSRRTKHEDEVAVNDTKEL